MNRCKTCAHWDRKYPIEPDQRLCLAKKLDSTDQDGARIAVVERRYAVFLATSPEFGCVHHKPIDGVSLVDGQTKPLSGTDATPLVSEPAVQPEQPQSDTVDAARYRWLRDKARGVDWSERFQAGAYRHYCRTSPDQMDAAIDAALSKSVQAATGGARYCDTCEQMVTEPCNSVDCSTPE